MAIDFLYPQYEVVRNNDRCINCRACERQCANEVHFWDADNNRMQADESKCVACHRCVALCPTRALKIVKTDHTFRENANWTGKAISEVYRQAGSGGVLLSSMGNPDPHPIYWDKILINASQVTNPSIDPLREPMETKTFLGKKPGKIGARRERQSGSQSGAAAGAQPADHVLRNELRLDLLQRTCRTCTRCKRAQHLL